MTKTEYREYLASPHWVIFRAEVLAIRGACERCHMTRLTSQFLYRGDLQLHHLTYERIGHELPSDVLVLCCGCHESEEQFKLNDGRWCSMRQIFKGWPEREADCPYCGSGILIGVKCAGRERSTGRYILLPPAILGSCECEEVSAVNDAAELGSFIQRHWHQLTGTP